jgi:formylglycine-generating enzyme required for sulfatase activity
MMRIFIVLFFIFQATVTYSQYRHSPPGTSKINDSIYIDQLPVTNVMYLEFLDRLQSFWSLEKHEEFKTAPKFGRPKVTPVYTYPNDLKKTPLLIEMSINETLTINDSLKTHSQYLINPKYSHHPVLQVTREQAEMFCLWRTDMVMYLYATAKNERRRNKYPKEIRYRLPTQEELIQAKTFFKEQKEFSFSKEESPLHLQLNDIKFRSFIFLNISEYTTDSIPFGSNWRNNAPTTFPNDYTGFRCICEVKY